MSSITSNDKRNTGFLVRFAFSVIIVALIATGSTATRVFANGYMSISKTETVQPLCDTSGGDNSGMGSGNSNGNTGGSTDTGGGNTGGSTDTGNSNSNSGSGSS